MCNQTIYPANPGTGALEKATELFQQEAKQLEQLGTHPQIPGLWAYFEEHSRLYLVQEFIEGENLLAELKKQWTFREEKIRGLDSRFVQCVSPKIE